MLKIARYILIILLFNKGNISDYKNVNRPADISRETLDNRAEDAVTATLGELAEHTDGIVSTLLGIEWMGVVCVRLYGLYSGRDVVPHVLLLPLLLALLAIAFVAIICRLRYQGAAVRRVLVIAQMVMWLLVGIVTGTDVCLCEMIALALAGCYRDWRVLASAAATATVATVTLHLAAFHWANWPIDEPRGLVVQVIAIAAEFIVILVLARPGVAALRRLAVRQVRLEWDANHDALTLLPNRRMLQAHFKQHYREGASSGAILYIDLDRFKQANDSLGHTLGDALLRDVAARLSTALGPGELLARIGGDEFVAFQTPAPDTSDAFLAARRLLDVFSSPFLVQGHSVLLNASIGISLYPEHGVDLDVLQERADRAMYLAKSNGGKQYALFSSEVALRETTLKQLSQDLYLALPRGDLYVEYQPIIGRNAEISSFESLVRWRHPEHGLIGPSEFIPLAEQSGLIRSIGDWVLGEACRSCASWQREGRPSVGVTVNISAAQFELESFAERVIATLQDSGLTPSLLTLEITESVLIRDLERTTRSLRLLRNLGIRIAIDDFGTGYSSLSYLMAIPADFLKLDRSFVTGDFPHRNDIIQFIVDLAHRLGMQVIAEGIETIAQHDRVRRSDCDQLQGFLVGRPLCAKDIPGFLNGCGRTRFAALEDTISRRNAA